MPDQLDAESLRRDAERMRTKAEKEADAFLRREYSNLAHHYELLALEVDRFLGRTGSAAAR